MFYGLQVRRKHFSLFTDTRFTLCRLAHPVPPPATSSPSPRCRDICCLSRCEHLPSHWCCRIPEFFSRHPSVGFYHHDTQSLTSFPSLRQCFFLCAHLSPAGCLQHTRVCLVHFDIVILQPALFFLCKGSASVILQGSQSLFVSKSFQRFWGAVAHGPNSLRPEGLKIFRPSLAFT